MQKSPYMFILLLRIINRKLVSCSVQSLPYSLFTVYRRVCSNILLSVSIDFIDFALSVTALLILLSNASRCPMLIVELRMTMTAYLT